MAARITASGSSSTLSIAAVGGEPTQSTNAQSTSAEHRLQAFGIELPTPPQPFGTYAEAVQTGSLLFLSGMLPTEGRAAKFIGGVGAELDTNAGA
jgi:hypothetical protein